MFERIEIRDEDFKEVIDKAGVNMVIRLANIQHNWSSILDKDLAKKVPKLKQLDEDTAHPDFGTYNKVSKTIRGGFILGHRVIDFFNLYCLEKDSSGKFSLNENYFIKALKEFEKNYKEKLIALLVRNEGAVNKPLVHKLLQKNIKFNKVQIFG